MPDEKGGGNEEWWLMDCAFPDLVWARVRDLEDGRAEVLEPGGRSVFPTRDDAVSYLREDEYTTLLTLQEEATDDEIELLGRSFIAELSAPSAATDEQLMNLLVERRSR